MRRRREGSRRLPLVFGAGNGALDQLGLEFAGVGEVVFLDEALDEGDLVVHVVDDEVARDAEGRAVLAQDAHRDAVESAHEGHEVARRVGDVGQRVGASGAGLRVDASGAGRRAHVGGAGLQEAPEPLAHFAGGFVRESDGQDVLRVGAVRDEVGDAVR